MRKGCIDVTIHDDDGIWPEWTSCGVILHVMIMN